MAVARAVDFSDVQGLVRFGHGQLRRMDLVLLRILDAAAVGQWLARAPVTTAAPVSPLPARVMQVAFTAAGLARLGLDDSLLQQFSEEFLGGMVSPNRSRRLGDTGSNAPEYWDWGGDETRLPHVLLLLYHHSEDAEAHRYEVMHELLFNEAFEVQQVLGSNPGITSEPFGFADGISQPHLDWEQTQTQDLHRRDNYSNLLSLGEILLGYPNEYGQYTDRPLLQALKHPGAAILPEARDQPGRFDLGCNGSYLVVRQLEQDVPGFWQFVDQAAAGNPDVREKLAEDMVGRRRNGSPLVQIAPRPIEGIPVKEQARNNFNFDSDRKGLVCPLAAHVRRSNPRTGDFPPGVKGLFSRLLRILGFHPDSRDLDLVASTRFHRILRRGRQYGPMLSPDEALTTPAGSVDSQGLHFMCLSANIARQFEFVQNAWVVNAKFAGLQDESDPLLGTGEALQGGSATNSFSQPQLSGVRQCTGGIPQFITVRGGGYFFLPGLRALRYLATLAAGPAVHAARSKDLPVQDRQPEEGVPT